MYSAQVKKEHCWLPRLSGYPPVDIPRPLGRGEPGSCFPRPWSVYEWLPGHHATVDRVADLWAGGGPWPLPGCPLRGRWNGRAGGGSAQLLPRRQPLPLGRVGADSDRRSR
ncbi:phosphotransferase [Salinispora pacifica]|uniref:phosphotransferase n=1 Tax=Salinispora pacifica TaxID=351187 RepID=UPI003B51053E